MAVTSITRLLLKLLHRLLQNKWRSCGGTFWHEGKMRNRWQKTTTAATRWISISATESSTLRTSSRASRRLRRQQPFVTRKQQNNSNIADSTTCPCALPSAPPHSSFAPSNVLKATTTLFFYHRINFSWLLILIKHVVAICNRLLCHYR